MNGSGGVSNKEEGPSTPECVEGPLYWNRLPCLGNKNTIIRIYPYTLLSAQPKDRSEANGNNYEVRLKKMYFHVLIKRKRRKLIYLKSTPSVTPFHVSVRNGVAGNPSPLKRFASMLSSLHP